MDRDRTLVANVLTGDMDSFAALVQAYQKPLYNFLLKMTFSKEDAEEILQEVFIKVYNRLYTYDDRFSFSTWIYRITINTYKSEYRKKKRNSMIAYFDELPGELYSLEDCPEEALEIKEHTREIIKILSCLKEDQRMAFILKHLQDLSYKEVGDAMRLSPEAARMKVHRAKVILIERFEALMKRGVGS